MANLQSIAARNGINCFNSLVSNKIQRVSIAHQTIQDRRATTSIPCGPGGFLHDYVPFYWAPRSPMLYAIHKGNVEGCTTAQGDIIYLVSTAESVRDSDIGFVFTDGHAIMAVSRFFDDLDHLGQIDWPLMRERYWRDTAEDPDRKRRRSAEFLVYKFFPLALVHGIAVMRQTTITKVRELLGMVGSGIDVRARADWYY
jgi:ssDNA thymidine ADP-ribosyltransferase, DarT